MTVEDIDNIEQFVSLDDNFLKFTCSNNKEGICDKFGNILIDRLFDVIYKLENINFFIARRDKNAYSIIKKDGQTVSLDATSYHDYIQCGNYLILKGSLNKKNTLFKKKYYSSIFDKNGNELLTVIDSNISYLGEDMFLIYEYDSKYYDYYSTKFHRYYEYHYYNAINNESFGLDSLPSGIVCSVYRGGYMLQKINDKYCYLDKSGKTKITPKVFATDFHKSMPSGKYTAFVKSSNEKTIMVIDKNENILFKLNALVFDIMCTDYDAFIIYDNRNDKYGVRDLNGNVIVPCLYKKITVANNGIIFCSKSDNQIDCYTGYGKKIENNTLCEYYYNTNNNDIILVQIIGDKANEYAFMNKDGEILFNGLTFSFISASKPNSNRFITERKEISYKANNICEYDRYSVVDIDTEEIIFTYPNDNKFNFLDSLYTDDYSYYIGKIKDKDKYLIIDEKGNEIKELNAIEKPLIKGNLVFFKYVYLEYKIGYKIYEILKNNEIRVVHENDADSIDFISKDTFIVTYGDKRYLNIITRDSESNSVISEYDISYKKGLTEKVRKRLLSR